MFIKISKTENSATIHESEVLSSFEIRSPENNPEKIVEIIGNNSSVAHFDHIWVSISWVLSQIQHKHDTKWEKEFENMITYANSKGWLSEDQTHLLAHIEIST